VFSLRIYSKTILYIFVKANVTFRTLPAAKQTKKANQINDWLFCGVEGSGEKSNFWVDLQAVAHSRNLILAD